MKYKLNGREIGTACEEVNAYLLKKKTASKDRIQTMFSLEETLLNYMSIFGTDAEFAIDFGLGFSKNKIRLSVPGESVDPFTISGTDSDEERFMANILTRMGQRPKWKYEHGVNTILFWFAAVSVAESKNVEVSLVWYVTAIIISMILSVASPPVPGGMAASFTILFAQLSLPMAELGVIVSLTSILDFVTTATDVYTQQCMLAMSARDIMKHS